MVASVYVVRGDYIGSRIIDTYYAMKQYSLSELTLVINSALSQLQHSTYWVRAEIASVSSRSGHGYFELVEKSPAGMLSAKMRATCWSNLFPMLSAWFAEQTGETLQAGMKVLVECEVTFHPVYGLSLNIVSIDPQYTLGDLARQRQETILRLQSEGYWDLQRELTLPTLTYRIAVVSAAQAAGYGDFCDQLQQSGYRFRTELFPAIVQGERAEGSIIEALQSISAHKDDFDAVVIIRGGGATTDLGCFDSYLLSEACAQFPLPVLTGIGHTRDVSIVDQVAHLSLKTPTAVAAFLVDRMAALDEALQRLKQRLKQVGEKQILIRRHRIELLRQRLQMCSPERIYRLGYSLAMADGRIIRNASELKAGQRLTTHLQSGIVESTVENTRI
jgi:exodeoxyribonuclease VII large subunit